MSLPVYQSEACILMKLIKDAHTTTSAREIFTWTCPPLDSSRRSPRLSPWPPFDGGETVMSCNHLDKMFEVKQKLSFKKEMKKKKMFNAQNSLECKWFFWGSVVNQWGEWSSRNHKVPCSNPRSPRWLHVEVSLSKTLNPQLLPGRFTAAHCSLHNMDGSNAEENFPTGEKKVSITFILSLSKIVVLVCHLVVCVNRLYREA